MAFLNANNMNFKYFFNDLCSLPSIDKAGVLGWLAGLCILVSYNAQVEKTIILTHKKFHIVLSSSLRVFPKESITEMIFL